MIALQHERPAINSKAAIWTVGVHALLLLLFFFLRYTISPLPPAAPDGGLEVNLGTSDNGSGTDQPMNTKDPAAYTASVVYKAVAPKSNLPKEIVRSSAADAPDVDENKKDKKNIPSENRPLEKPKPAPVEKPKYIMPSSNGPGGNSAAQNRPGTSEGNTTGPGDRGVPGGTPGAPNYTGVPGNGNGGIHHTLGGRRISPDHFEAEFHEGGKVVIHVTVDKNGNIINRLVKSSSNKELTRLALEKLASAHFDRSESPEQSGDITINFSTR